MNAFDLWDVVEISRDPPPVPANPTVAQMKHHSEENAKKYKAMSAIQQYIADEILNRIMNYDNPKEAWEILKEFQGDERTRQMQILNLRREFEILRMKSNETVKEYTDRLVRIVSQIRLLGEELSE